MPKKTPETRSPRLIRRGDVVQQKGVERSEVVRDVSVVLHLANGQDEVYHVSEAVTLADPEEHEPAPEIVALAAQDDAKAREEEKKSYAKRVAKPAQARREIQ